MIVVARRSGICAFCEQAIHKGDKLAVHPFRRAMHLRCSLRRSAAVRVEVTVQVRAGYWVGEQFQELRKHRW